MRKLLEYLGKNKTFEKFKRQSICYGMHNDYILYVQ